MYVNLREMLKFAESKKIAIGAFNITGHLTAQAVIAAAEEAKTPVIMQTSVSTVKQIGVQPLLDMLKPLAEKASVPVGVHLDHSTDVALCKACVDAGWSSVMYDGSKESFEDNLTHLKEVVEYAKKTGATVEGEIGAIVGIEDNIFVSEDESALADPDLAIRLANESGIDLLAPAIGTAHGVYKGEPKIDFERLQTIVDGAGDRRIVIHGGTGLAKDVFKRVIEMGASKINVSTALKYAYIDGLYSYIDANRTQYDPLKVDKACLENVKKTVLEHIDIFGRA